ncbi:peptidylprolyl isomerase [Maricaulaceae bacterium EIL42A08]|nr:peptidylprolyl isomerase [Maricaulaceae bacterium EIL42A08]
MALRTALILVAALVATSFATKPASAQQVEGIAAVVNDQPITTLDVRNRMRLIITSAGVQPDEAMLTQIQDQAIRALIEESLQLQQAEEFDLTVDEAEVDAALQDAAARNGSTVDEVAADLRANGIDVETLRQQIRAEIAWQIMVSGRYRSRIRISDQQIETALARQAEAAAQPQYSLAEIVIEIRTDGGEERAAQTVQAVYGALSNGAPFPEVAAQFSDAPSAARGGFTGWLSEASIRPQVLEIVRQLQAGQISNPIRVPGGFQIVAVVEKREGQVVEQLDLIQLTLPSSRITEGARSALTEAMADISSCDAVENAVSSVEGVIVTELADLNVSALIPQIRNALAGLEPVSATDVLETAAGLQAFVVCDRGLTGPGVPTVDEIENQLINQQLSLLARRWLRDLRRDATVEIR